MAETCLLLTIFLRTPPVGAQEACAVVFPRCPREAHLPGHAAAGSGSESLYPLHKNAFW